MKLIKGQRLPLINTLHNNEKNFRIEILANGLDIIGFGLDSNGKVINNAYILFREQVCTPCQAICISFANESVEITLNLTKIHPDIACFAFAVVEKTSINNGKLIITQLISYRNASELASFEFSIEDFNNQKSLLLGEVYRRNNEWRFNARAQSFMGGICKLIEYYGGSLTVLDSALQNFAENNNLSSNQGIPNSSPKEQFNQGIRFARGEGVPKDEVEASIWFRKAAEQGFAEAQYNLALCYANGLGMKQNQALAADWFLKAAIQGHANAQYELGFCYLCGEGVEESVDDGIIWCRNAADQGQPEAQYLLGVLYQNGDGVDKSFNKAVEWYTKAAEQGNANAQLALGSYYENNQEAGVKENAINWYLQAANQGLAEAQTKLANCYFYGNGVIKSPTEAAYWYRKADEQGNVDAEYFLGNCFLYGIGVEQDLGEATKQHRKAQEHGYFDLQFDAVSELRISMLLDDYQSFELIDLTGEKMGKAVQFLEDLIEKKSMTCRIYTAGRTVVLGGIFNPLGVAAAAAIAAHNLATYDPDYEIAKHKIDKKLTVKAKSPQRLEQVRREKILVRIRELSKKLEFEYSAGLQ